MRGMDMMGVGVLINYSVAGLHQITSMDKAISRLWVQTEKGNMQLTAMGKSMVTVAAGAVSLAAGIAMVNAAMGNIDAAAGYETSMAHVQGLLVYSREEMANFEEAAFQMAQTSRYTAGEAMDAIWELLSAGYSERQVLEMLEATMQTAVIGKMELAEAADMVTSAMKGFQIPAEQADHLVDMLTTGVRISKIHFDEYSRAFGTFAGVAHAANQPIEESIALFGILRSAGMSGSRAATMMRMMYNRVMAASPAVMSQLSEMGVQIIDPVTGSVRSMIDVLEDLFAVLPELPELTGKSAEQIEDMFEEMAERGEYAHERLRFFADMFGARAVAGVYSVMNAQMELNGILYEGTDAFRAMSNEILYSEGAAASYYGILMDTWEEQRALIDSMINLVKVQIGTGMLEGLKPVLNFVVEVLTHISNFLTAYPQVAAALGYALALGGVILTVGGMILLLAGLAGVIKMLLPMIGLISIVVGGVLQAGLVIAGVVAAIIAYWNTLQSAVVSAWDWFTSRFSNSIRILGLYVQSLWKGIQLFWEILKPMFPYILGALGVVAVVILGVLTTFFSILRVAIAVQEIILAFFTALFTWDWDGFKTEIARIWEELKIDIAGLGGFFVETMVAAIRDIIPNLREAIGLPAERTTAERVAMGILAPTTLLTATGSFASGVTEVPRDGLAFVHEGEEITQRGRASSRESRKLSIGTVNFNVYGNENPEEFTRRSYAELQRLLANDMANTVRA